MMFADVYLVTLVTCVNIPYVTHPALMVAGVFVRACVCVSMVGKVSDVSILTAAFLVSTVVDVCNPTSAHACGAIMAECVTKVIFSFIFDVE